VRPAVFDRQRRDTALAASPPGSTVPRLLVGLGIAVPVLLAAMNPLAWVQVGTVTGSALLAAAGGWLLLAACADNGPEVDVADRVVELATISDAAGILGLAVVAEAASAPKAYAAALAMLEANRALVGRLDLQVAQSRALQRRLVTAADTERHQLAARLGASVLPLLDELTGTLHQIEDGPVPHAVQAAAHEALGEVAHAVEDLQRIAGGLHPRLLSDVGLRGALENLAARSPINVVVSAPAGRYPSAVEATLWYVCAEALTNAVKHAQATRVTVDVQDFADEVVARVGDDGRTTRSVDLADAEGGGLSGVRDRVLACGGSLALLTGLSGGVVVEVRVPR
jgi:signal transduction histidine kinase